MSAPDDAQNGIVPPGLDATLVLVRHGESEYIVEGRFQGQAETPLSPLGLRQADMVARRLAEPHERPALPVPTGVPLELIHSPLQRTSQTADAIARAMAGSTTLGSPIPPLRPDDGFREIGQGAWEGLHRDEIAQRYSAELAIWRRRPTEVWAPGGESLAQVARRTRPALERLLARLAAAGTPGTRDRDQVPGYAELPADHPWSILVGHDGVFKIALLTLFELPLERFWMWTMDLCAITVIEFRGGQPVVRAHNLTGHLATLLDEEAVEAQEARSRSGAL
ncbi:MAG: histidine phosphatase family protein [Chloroflexota bacterium]|nr:histidine phosphatase family protein [Chloroflexota bacterium]